MLCIHLAISISALIENQRSVFLSWCTRDTKQQPFFFCWSSVYLVPVLQPAQNNNRNDQIYFKISSSWMHYINNFELMAEHTQNKKLFAQSIYEHLRACVSVCVFVWRALQQNTCKDNM